jgi:short-subunit dehydrogenase
MHMGRTQSYFRDKVALITGASSGIGQELAWQLAQSGAKLTLAARRKVRLDALAQKIAGCGNSDALVAECDVTRDGDLDRAVEATVRKWGRLDVAIANAGFGVVGALKRLSLEDYRRQFETNVFGVLRTIYAALPEIEKTEGNLVIISSVAGWISTSGGSPYSMSKFALRALANAITPELQPGGVKVTLISPGFVDSEIQKVDNQGEFHADRKSSVPGWIRMSTPRAARQILSAVARGKRERIITLHGKIGVAIERFSPWMNRAIARRIARSSDRSPG